jgi:Fungal specific transcription factor domain/Fungal Zn(2)-Cys(6) binuclear cluster domain
MSTDFKLPQTTEKKISTRVSKACDSCSRYRRKCDGNLPCLLCIQKNRNCIYTRVVKKRGPEAKKLEKLKDQVLELSRKVKLAAHTNTNASYNTVMNWTRKDFLKLGIVDKFGRTLTLVDLYFVYTYISLPLLSRSWVIEHFNDIPLHLLHSMYIAALMGQNLPGNAESALEHAKLLRKELYSRMDDCDPFVIVSLIHLAFYEFASTNRNSSLAHIAFAIREAQMMGLDVDKVVTWPSESTGRILGNDFGLDKQFLRSIWFLLYLWDNNNHLMFGAPTLISIGIPSDMILGYVSPNIGDSSNIPQK